MRIALFIFVCFASRGLCGVLYHRQHAAFRDGFKPSTPYIGSFDDGSNYLFGGQEDDSANNDLGESLRVIKITRTFAVPVPVPVPYTKEVPVPFAVPKPVPVAVPHPVPIHVHKAIVVPQPIPIPLDHLSPPSGSSSYYHGHQDLPQETNSPSAAGYSQHETNGYAQQEYQPHQ